MMNKDSTTSLRLTLEREFNEARKARQTERVEVLSFVLSVIKNEEIQARVTGQTVHDAHILTLLRKIAKQCEETAQGYEKANRPELVQKEREKIAIIHSFLPPLLSESELKDLIQKTIQELQLGQLKDMKHLMQVLKERYADQLDLGMAGALAKKYLT